MQYQNMARTTLATATTLMGAASAMAARRRSADKSSADSAPDSAPEYSLDSSLEALKTFDWSGEEKAPSDTEKAGPGKRNKKGRAGTGVPKLSGIEKAIPATHGNAAARKDLETRLAAVLGTGASRAAKDYVCRKLKIIGTAASVPALAAILPDKELSHVARIALEWIPGPEAGKALRDALGTTSGAQKVGVIGSLGARRDTECVAALAALVADTDPAIAAAAATALGDIGTPESAQALAGAKPASDAVKAKASDGCLTCAERLLAAGKKAEAKAVYTSLLSGNPSKNVRLAATRGLLLASGKKE